ncbi:hypothetical protein C8Q74DRAFT_414121 [Fomes fomentarius]|nr:hypothetical protein C8Q74DRAFT_414121 [Fomes fomentarius]
MRPFRPFPADDETRDRIHVSRIFGQFEVADTHLPTLSRDIDPTLRLSCVVENAHPSPRSLSVLTFPSTYSRSPHTRPASSQTDLLRLGPLATFQRCEQLESKLPNLHSKSPSRISSHDANDVMVEHTPCGVLSICKSKARGCSLLHIRDVHSHRASPSSSQAAGTTSNPRSPRTDLKPSFANPKGRPTRDWWIKWTISHRASLALLSLRAAHAIHLRIY